MRLNLFGTQPIITIRDPQVPMEAANKNYVDNLMFTHESRTDIHLTPGQNALLDGLTASQVELNHLSGVTSNIQTQLNARVLKAGDAMTGFLTLHASPVASSHAVTKEYSDTQDNLRVLKAGDVMTGALTLHGNPTSALHATPRQYVDAEVAAHAGNAALHITAAQNTLLDGLTVTHTELNRVQGVTAPIQAQIDSKANRAGDTFTGPVVLHADPAVPLGAATRQYVDAADNLRVLRAGDTLTGFLTLHANPTLGLHAAPRQYVDSVLAAHATDASLHITTAQNTLLDGITVLAADINQLAGVTAPVQTQLNARLALAGGTMTGDLVLAGLPTLGTHATNRNYVDTADNLRVLKSGDTMTGFLTLHAAPTANLHAATKLYVDSAITGLTTTVNNQDNLRVLKSGDTMTGFLVLHANPTLDLQAATKLYVDNGDTAARAYADTRDALLQTQISTLQSTVSTLNADPVTMTHVTTQDNLRVLRAGDTLTGYLTLHANPQQNMHPATKQYVDAVAQGLQTKPSVRLATTVNLNATYNNGSFGVNATLTGNVNGALSVDGVNPLVNDRVLVRLQTNAVQNGDYVVQQTGNASTPFILRRVETVDQSSEVPGSYFYVFDGLTLRATGWVMTVTNPVTFAIGTDPIFINQFSGQGSIIAGNGLTLSGNTIDINTANPGRIVVNADNIDLATTGVVAGTYTRLTVDGFGRATSGSNPTTLAGYGISDGQPLNANLTSLSGVTTTGLIVRDATNNFVSKEIVVSGIGISITNGGGINAGNITLTSNATNLNTPSTVVARDASGNFSANTVTAALDGNATTATTLQTNRSFAITGAVTATAVNFNGSANVTFNTTMSTTGVAAGSYTRVVVGTDGRVTAGTNPSTVADMGLTDAVTIAQLNARVIELERLVHEAYAYIVGRT